MRRVIQYNASLTCWVEETPDGWVARCEETGTTGVGLDAVQATDALRIGLMIFFRGLERKALLADRLESMFFRGTENT